MHALYGLKRFFFFFFIILRFMSTELSLVVIELNAYKYIFFLNIIKRRIGENGKWKII